MHDPAGQSPASQDRVPWKQGDSRGCQVPVRGSWPVPGPGRACVTMLILALALTVALVFADVQDMVRRTPGSAR